METDKQWGSPATIDAVFKEKMERINPTPPPRKKLTQDQFQAPAPPCRHTQTEVYISRT